MLIEINFEKAYFCCGQPLRVRQTHAMLYERGMGMHGHFIASEEKMRVWFTLCLPNFIEKQGGLDFEKEKKT